MSGPMESLFLGRSAVRREVLERFLTHPELLVHASALAREIGRPPEVVSRELRRLERASLLSSETLGRARRYRADTDSPLWADFSRLAQKTIGVEAKIRQALADVSGIEVAFIYGSYAAGRQRASSDIDLCIVGTADRRSVRRRLVDVEHLLDRDVNFVQYRESELSALARTSAFVQDLLRGPKIRLIGDPGALSKR